MDGKQRLNASQPPWYQVTLGNENLRYLANYFAIQTLVIALFVVAFYVSWGFDLPSRLVLVSLPAQFLVTLVAFRLALKMQVVKTWHYLLMLMLSVFMLGWFLHDSGGYTNPLISLLLVPIAMSAAMLAWQASVVLAVLVIGLYVLLMNVYVPLGDDAMSGHHHGSQMMQMHLFGMWVTFCLSVVLILVLVIPMAASIRKQRETIAQQREQSLQDERIVAMATFAASAAHQLGTPLSTLSVIADDLADEFKDRPQVQEDIKTMSEQIALCKSTLHAMMRRADAIRNHEHQIIPIEQFLKNVRSQFNLLNPGYSVELEHIEAGNLLIKSDETLEQAVLNLLDNAVKASNSNPKMESTVQENQVCIRIVDTGPGVSQAIQNKIGQPFISTRDNHEGMGLGLFLSNSTINRLGGRLTLSPTEKGTVTEVWLPLVSASEDTLGVEHD